MRLKIYTDGKPENTKIMNAKTGEQLTGVTHTEIIIEPFNITAILILNDIELDLEIEEDSVHTGN